RSQQRLGTLALLRIETGEWQRLACRFPVPADGATVRAGHGVREEIGDVPPAPPRQALVQPIRAAENRSAAGQQRCQPGAIRFAYKRRPRHDYGRLILQRVVISVTAVSGRARTSIVLTDRVLFNTIADTCERNAWRPPDRPAPRPGAIEIA